MPKKYKSSDTHHQEHDHDGDGHFGDDHDHIVRPGPDLEAPALTTSSGYEMPDPQERSLDPFGGQGFTFRGKDIVDLDQVIEQIDSGNSQKVNGGTITYTFLEEGRDLNGLYNNKKYGFTAAEGLGSFSAAQRAEARDSIELWDDLVDATFVEKKGRGADIQFANSADPAQAYAYYPEYDFTNAQGWKFFGDVFVADPAINWTNDWLSFGGYGATTLIHEIGHSLGLSHPGAYNGAGATTYAAQAEYAQDSEQYSIMSYWNMAETSNQPFAFGAVDWSTGYYNNPQTPLVHDILTIQDKYGADPTTRAGDTVYGWNSTAGNEVYDFSVNLFPYLSIYDAGGIDTIDMSGANASVFINLEPGSFSSGASEVPDESVINAARAAIPLPGGVGPVAPGTQERWMNLTTGAHEGVIEFEYGYSGVGVTNHDNLSIAYGTIIENAIGSTQRDVLWGNDVDNVLEGLGGDDVLNGRAGNDTLLGGDGADTFEFSDVGGTDTIGDFESGVDAIDLTAFGGMTFIDDADFSNTVGELRYVDGQLQGDVDGDGVADFFINVEGDGVVAGDLLL